MAPLDVGRGRPSVLHDVDFARASEAFTEGSEAVYRGVDDAYYVHDGVVCRPEVHLRLLHVAQGDSR